MDEKEQMPLGQGRIVLADEVAQPALTHRVPTMNLGDWCALEVGEGVGFGAAPGDDGLA